MNLMKINLQDTEGILYEGSMKNRTDEHAASVRYTLDILTDGMTKTHEADGKSAYHLLLEGDVCYKGKTEVVQKAMAGQTFGCEPEENMEISGHGRMLSMLMDRGMRGTIRVQTLKNEETLKIGEAIGDSCMLITSLEKEIHIFCNNQCYTCGKDNALLFSMPCGEYVKLRLTSDEPTQIAVFNSIKMFNADFGKHIGIRTMEQEYGRCKVRLDVKEHHMNPIGSVHGGVVFTMADAASGIAASTTGGLCTTVSSHIEFLNAAMNVEYLVAEAKAKKIGKKIRTFTVDITDEKNHLISSAEFVFFCLQN